jgi:DNA (cytosine-5)-methyltransferase 1
MVAAERYLARKTGTRFEVFLKAPLWQRVGNGRFGHPEQDRALSLREGALLQTFPPDYEFFEPGSKYFFTHIVRHIGNAVPVELGRVIARSIRKHLEDHGK